MNFKYDTKSNHVYILLKSENVDDNLAETLQNICRDCANGENPNFIIDFNEVKSATRQFPEELFELQKQIYENGASMIFTRFSPELTRHIHQSSVAQDLVFTPTLIEAIDMVSMEDLERDLLSEPDEE